MASTAAFRIENVGAVLKASERGTPARINVITAFIVFLRRDNNESTVELNGAKRRKLEIIARRFGSTWNHVSKESGILATGKPTWYAHSLSHSIIRSLFAVILNLSFFLKYCSFSL